MVGLRNTLITSAFCWCVQTTTQFSRHFLLFRLSKQELSSFRIGRHQPINLEIDIDENTRKQLKMMLDDGSGTTNDQQSGILTKFPWNREISNGILRIFQDQMKMRKMVRSVVLLTILMVFPNQTLLLLENSKVQEILMPKLSKPSRNKRKNVIKELCERKR